MKYDFYNKNPLWHIHEGIVLKVGQILIDGEVVQTYPDNDGGYWYFDKNGRVVQVNDKT